ncbi:hypothetical protein H4R19_006098, partial [Coemansia spiralis]
MNLCDLPSDILTMVLRRSLYSCYNGRLPLSERNDKRWFERNLELLDVCPQLRCIALPLVYKVAHVDAFDDLSTMRDEFNEDWSRGEPGHSTPNDLEA